MEIALFKEDYLRFSPLLMPGTALYITGQLKPRFGRDEWEFRVGSISLAENIKESQTKQLLVEIHPAYLNEEWIDFLAQNLKTYRNGDTSLRLVLKDPTQNLRISLQTGTNSFRMNDELIQFLEEKPECEIQVQLN
jgi:DNA polymerase-3 subunit alpha